MKFAPDSIADPMIVGWAFRAEQERAKHFDFDNGQDCFWAAWGDANGSKRRKDSARFCVASGFGKGSDHGMDFFYNWITELLAIHQSSGDSARVVRGEGGGKGRSGTVLASGRELMRMRTT